jgi:hypothetical protein
MYREDFFSQMLHLRQTDEEEDLALLAFLTHLEIVPDHPIASSPLPVVLSSFCISAFTEAQARGKL